MSLIEDIHEPMPQLSRPPERPCTGQDAIFAKAGKRADDPLPTGTTHAGLVASDSLAPSPLLGAHAKHACSLAWSHRDLFDRMLAAQAMPEQLTLVTQDPVFSEVRISTLW